MVVQQPKSSDPHPFTYLFHLLPPALLLIDILHAGRLRMAGTSDLLLAALAGFWIPLALAAFLAARDRGRFLLRVRGPLLSVYTVFFCLMALELGLWAAYRAMPPAVWRPGTHVVFRPDPEVFSGVSGVAHFHVNELGLRGPTLDRAGSAYKIVAVGGSTTLSLMLDGSKTWPEQLMQEMNARQQGTRVWVGNAGVNGHTAVHHLTMLRHLTILAQADLILILCGLNDLQNTLAFEGASTQAQVQKSADQYRDYLLAGAAAPFPLYRHLRLYRFARKATDWLIERASSEQRQELWDAMALRSRRAAGPVSAIPDLTSGREEYRQRLHTLAAECTRLRRRCVFLTQPTIWRSDLQADVEKLLLFGWVGPKFRPRGYVSVPELSRGMDSYNQVMLDVCRANNLECYDLAAALPKDASVFYDDAHFTENGARLVARSISRHLLAMPPFRVTAMSRRAP
ncbi:MAG: hypothetical protein DMD98_17545 [Candidatus Rokuibacteriota bacterium]|nr:MAG: hypothetical protein DMD98_17545 [Candidatus Rokubacteria bacterium]